MPDNTLASTATTIGDLVGPPAEAMNTSEKLKNLVSANPTIAAMLLAGGGAGLLGGYLTHLQPEDKTEDKKDRRKRIIRNALLTGLGSASAVGLGSEAYKRFATAAPAGEQSSVAKITEKAVGKPADPGLGRAIGSAALGLAGAAKGGVKDLAELKARLIGAGGQGKSKLSDTQAAALASMQSKDEINEFVKKIKNRALKNNLTQVMGVGEAGPVGRAISQIPYLRKPLGALLGKNRAGLLGRLGLLGGYFLPEMAQEGKEQLLGETE